MTTTTLVQYCLRRWNSDLVGPDGDTSGSGLKRLMPDKSEITKVKSIIRILKLFEAFSSSVSADKAVNIHNLVPMLVTITLGLETTQKLIKDPLIQGDKLLFVGD